MAARHSKQAYSVNERPQRAAPTVVGMALTTFEAKPCDDKKRWATTKMITLESTITCPECGFQKTEQMPTNACIHFYECENCNARLKPRAGDCCVFCSYGNMKCPGPLALRTDRNLLLGVRYLF